MTTHDKTIRLARMIGLDYHASESKQKVWRQVKGNRPKARRGTEWYEWHPYGLFEDYLIVVAWVRREYPASALACGCKVMMPVCYQQYCDAVLAAFDTEPAPTELAEHNDAVRNEWRERAEKAEAECDKLREDLRLMTRDRDRYERRFGDYSQKLREWQEETGCSHPTAAAEELKRLTADLVRAKSDAETYLLIGRRRGTENEILKATLADITNATTAALDERCDCGERHCTCVPLLRQEVKRLAAELADSKRDYEHYVNDVRTVEEWLLARVTADRDACVAFIVNEMAWCEFRGEMLCDSVSVQNTKKLTAFLDRHNAATAAERQGE